MSSQLPIAPRCRHNFATIYSDKEPTSVSTQGSGTDSEFSRPQQLPQACSICSVHEARYTCPKCKIPYCSLICYQSHKTSENGTGLSCTESFYQERVTQVLQLEVKEKRNDLDRILNRVHNDPHPHDSVPGVLSQQSISVLHNRELSEIELEQLLVVLEQSEHNNKDVESLLRTLPSRVQKVVHRIQREMEQGTGNLHEWILYPWHPWWRMELVSVDRNEEEEEEEPKQTVALHERVLAIPPLEMLRPSKVPTIPLQFNLIDILYGVAWVLRLYHGSENACDETIVKDAMHSFFTASAVISTQESSFCFTNLESVLTSCTQRCTTAAKRGRGECHTPWMVLCEDVALICKNERRVARALFEADDVVKAAIQATKKENDCCDDAIRSMRKIRKKFEFLLSWSFANKIVVQSLSHDIEQWVTDWNLKESDEIDSLRFPEHQRIPSHPKSKFESLNLEEIITTKFCL